MTVEGSPDLIETDSDRNSVYQIYDIGVITSGILGSVRVTLIQSRNVSETKVTVKYVPQANICLPKERHSTMSTEELSERWQIGLGQSRETNTKTAQIITR